MPDTVVLVDLEGKPKAFLEPEDIAVTRQWCGAASVAASVDAQDVRASALSVADVALQVFIDGALRFHGKVGEPLTTSTGQENAAIVAADPFDELAARLLQSDETYTNEDAGAIAWASIAAENARNDVRVREGAIAPTVNRTVTFQAGSNRADVLNALSQMDGGFGFALDPVGNVAGVLAELNVYAAMQRNAVPGVRFEYGRGTLANLAGFQEELMRPRNRVVAQGSALSDGSRPQAVAEDVDSQNTYGLWEYQVSVETSDTAVLAARAAAELRPAPIAVYTITPGPESPLLFADFDAGDVVNLAIRWGRVDVVGSARVDQATIRRAANSGRWYMDSMTLAMPASIQRVARRPADRYFALVGGYRDRLAVLERARLVGA